MLRGERFRWTLAEPADQAKALADALRVDPLIGQLLCQRGIEEPAAATRFFYPNMTDLHDPALLPGCEPAAMRIVQAMRDDQPIVIYGDYDVDGVTATAILHHMILSIKPDAALKRYIPHRIDEGYGLNGEAITKLAEGGAKLIVSVDCGITATEPAATAGALGVDLIITDHHEMGEQLPDCHTIVHPRLHERDESVGVAYPYGELCGAGVAFKLAWQIARAWCGNERVPQVQRELLVHLLSLAALGTVADVVPLVDENRIIVRFGLGNIKRTPFDGLNALIDASRLREETIDAFHVGFVLGPRLNACGRMGHAISACKLLTTATGDEADQIAAFLHEENEKRRDTERRIVDEASEAIRQRGYDRNDVRAIVLEQEGWHAGVIGIVCSRLVERFGRPTILLAVDNGTAQGSGRSIEGFNLHAALETCATHLTTWGGHAMAAGMKLSTEAVEPFREAMVGYANDRIAIEELIPTLKLDGSIPLTGITVNMIDAMDRLAPFGRCNARPTLLVEAVRVSQPPKVVGARGKHLVLTVEQAGVTRRGICWNAGEFLEKLATGQTLNLAVRPKINEWNGRRSPEMEIVDWAVVG